MSNSISKAILAAATIGIALVPVVALAKTRAGDSKVIYTSPAKQGSGRSAKGSWAVGEEVAIAALSVAVIVGGIITLFDDDAALPAPPAPPPSPPVSPGT